MSRQKVPLWGVALVGLAGVACVETTSPSRQLAPALGDGVGGDESGDAAGDADRPGSGSWSQEQLTTVFGQRDYWVYSPAGYQSTRAAPLILVLHGCQQSAREMVRAARLETLADAHGIVLVAPEQSMLVNSLGCWNWFEIGNQRRDQGEPAILVGIVDRVVQQRAIDPQRISVWGLSAGAAMAVILASCYADVFAAAVSHSGLAYEAATNGWEAAMAMQLGAFTDPATAGWDAYQCSGFRSLVMPTLVIHGKADSAVALVNAGQTVAQLAQMGDYADDGQDNDTISEAVVTGQTEHTSEGGLPFWVEQFADGVYERVLIEDMGHGWSGGDPASTFTCPLGPDATGLAWDFVDRFRRQ